MREITIDAKPIEVLKINIGSESFSLPLMGSLPFEDAMKIKNGKTEERLEYLTELLKSNIPEDLYKKLTSDTINQIIKAWSKESTEAAGITPGELSALQNS